MRITLLDFGSLLTYAPRGESPAMEQAKEVMKVIKRDGYIEEQPPIVASEWIAKTVKQYMDKLPFASFFQTDTVLVPIPSSSLMQPNSLWVPYRIATAMVKYGIGKNVIACLNRKTAVRKASWSKASERPSPREHFESMGVQGLLPDSLPNQVVLIDDIITRGATSLGAANRLAEALPNAKIRVFAVMRTMSNSSEFETAIAPVIGTIQYRPQKDDTMRKP